LLRTAYRKNWVVCAKPPFRGPEHLLQDLARYTHRVAISNHRIINVADGRVTFRWKDYAHGGKSVGRENGLAPPLGKPAGLLGHSTVLRCMNAHSTISRCSSVSLSPSISRGIDASI
jgi:hypothetical protein